MIIRYMIIFHFVCLFTYAFSQDTTVIFRQSDSYEVPDVVYDWHSFSDGSKWDWGWFQTCYTWLTSETAQTRVVLKFDLLSIPKNAHIIDAKLGIHLFGNMQGEGAIHVYRVTSPWKEEWLKWESPWINPGGDIDSNSMISTPIKSPGEEGINELDVTSIIQDFVSNPRRNLGLHLFPYPYDNEKVCRQISFSESEEVEKRPFLKVAYDFSTNTKFSINPDIRGKISHSVINNKLHVSNAPAEANHLKLFSLNGVLILDEKHKTLKANYKTFNLENIQEGLYIAEISGGGHSIAFSVLRR